MATSAAYIDLDEGAAPATPASGKVRVYAKTDGSAYQKDDAGTETGLAGGGGGGIATDSLWDAAGDMVQGTGANTSARLALGAAGTVLRSTGSTNAYAFPPGHEFDYVAFTSPVSITATTEGTANTVVTGTSVAYDGSTVIIVEFYAPNGQPDTTATGASLNCVLLDGATVIAGWFPRIRTPAAVSSLQVPLIAKIRLTPSAASHQYIVKAYVSGGTGGVNAGAGGAGTYPAGYIRVTKA
jgi:hypothetical protein